MKNLLLSINKSILAFLFLLISFSAFSQNAERRVAWHGFLTLNNVHDGDFKEGLDYSVADLGLETGFSAYLNSSFNASAYIGMGALEYEEFSSFNLVDFLNLELLAEYKFNNGYILREDFWIKPYLTAGIGFTDQGIDNSADIPVGAGIKFRLTDNLDLNTKVIYHSMLADNSTFDYLQTKIGLSWAIGGEGKPKDKDKDGVTDDVDACPEEKGLAEYNGCPPPLDTDGDGVADAVDSCPQVAGLQSFKGCPDTDNDGVIDSEDECPQIKGTKEFSGCLPPDTDGDGVPDASDQCPNAAGPKAQNGCPDTDGDGVLDKNDACPNTVGVSANNGCPELTVEEQEVLVEALEGVNFLSGKDVLTEESKPKLDHVAEILNAHPTYKIKVSGYTDSSGDESSNLALSKKRANAVKDYLITDNVAADRIIADGYGEANPVADNGTSAGRAKNRRVEFEIVFE